MPGNDANTKLLLHANGGDGVKSAYAHYKCNDNAASLTVTDDGSGGNNGTSSTNTSNLTASGRINECFDFDGSSEYFSTDQVCVDTRGDTTGSFSVWINYDNVSMLGTAFGWTLPGNLATYAHLEINDSAGAGSTYFTIWDNSVKINQIIFSTDIAPSGWNHIVVVQDGVAIKCYLNGVEDTGATLLGSDNTAWLSALSSHTVTNFTVGRLEIDTNQHYWNGNIDDLRYFQNCALSQAEVDTLYNSSSGTENSIIVDEKLTSPHTEVQTFADAQYDTAIKKWGASSLSFNGTGYVTVPDSADWDVFGDNTANSTIDCQYRTTSFIDWDAMASQQVDANNYWMIFHEATTRGLSMLAKVSGATILDTWNYNTSGIISDSNFHHIAWIKVGSYLAWYLDGNQVDFGWLPTEFTEAAELQIGAKAGASLIIGNLDEFRVQADNYFLAAPNSFPAASLLVYGEGLDGDTTVANDGYSGAVTLTNATLEDSGPPELNATTSLYFNGTNAYATVVDTSGTDYDMFGSATDSWTVDMWVKHADHVGTEAYIYQFDSGGPTFWRVQHIHGTGLDFRSHGGAGLSMQGGEITDTNWHHVAGIKSEANVGLYLDGVQVGFDNAWSTFTVPGSVTLGAYNSGTTPFDGYMEQAQITKGNKFKVTPMPEPFAHYKLNDNAATSVVADSGSGSNNGVAYDTGGTINTSTIYDASGKINSCLTFDATNGEFINIDALQSAISTDTSGSFAFWFAKTGAGARFFNFGHTAVDYYEYMQMYIAGSDFVVTCRNAAGGTFNWVNTYSSWPGNPTGWQHIVLVQDGTSPKVYLNGVDITNLTTTTDTTCWFSSMTGLDNGRLMCGNIHGVGDYQHTSGSMDDFRYYKNTVLSAAQVQFLYNSGNGTEEAWEAGNITVPTAVLTQDTITVPSAEYGPPALGRSQAVIIA